MVSPPRTSPPSRCVFIRAPQYRRLTLATVTARIRSFVALSLPEPNLAALERHLVECARTAPAYRWVEPDSLHLTLRFLGNLEPPVLERVRGELAAVLAAPFPL